MPGVTASATGWQERSVGDDVPMNACGTPDAVPVSSVALSGALLLPADGTFATIVGLALLRPTLCLGFASA